MRLVNCILYVLNAFKSIVCWSLVLLSDIVCILFRLTGRHLGFVQVAVEAKQGQSNLERVCEELLQEEKEKKEKRELKRQKKRKKKGTGNGGVVVVAKDDALTSHVDSSCGDVITNNNKDCNVSHIFERLIPFQIFVS